MDRGIDGWDENQAMTLLAAMSDVGSRAGNGSGAHGGLVVGAARHVFGLQLDPADLAPCSPEELAAELEDPAQRELAIQFLVLVPYADTQVEPVEVSRVDEYAETLGVEPHTLADLHKVREGHIRRLLVDYTRRAAGAVKMPGDDRGIIRRTISEIHQYVGDPKMVARYLPLADAPVGTLGRTFFDFYRAAWLRTPRGAREPW